MILSIWAHSDVEWIGRVEPDQLVCEGAEATPLSGTYTVSGRITDAAGTGVEGARVQTGETHFVYTVPDGSFSMPGLVSGSRTFSVEKNGVNASREILLKQKDLEDIDIVLE